MNELELQKNLISAIRLGLRGSVVFKHSDRLTSGIPDLSVSWLGRTTWLEIKFANPKFIGKGIQKKVMQDLSRVAKCAYVIFAHRKTGGLETVVIAPDSVDDWESCLDVAPGFDYGFVVQYLRRAHGGDAQWPL